MSTIYKYEGNTTGTVTINNASGAKYRLVQYKADNENAVPISQGGTGATTAGGALTNLGLDSLISSFANASVGSWTSSGSFSTKFTLGSKKMALMSIESQTNSSSNTQLRTSSGSLKYFAWEMVVNDPIGSGRLNARTGTLGTTAGFFGRNDQTTGYLIFLFFNEGTSDVPVQTRYTVGNYMAFS